MYRDSAREGSASVGIEKEDLLRNKRSPP
jgi:hypothetical protein